MWRRCRVLICLSCASCASCASDLATPAELSQHLGRRQSAVLGGSTVPQGQFDEVANHSCSGVLIAPNWVLTAEHCGDAGAFTSLAHRQIQRSVVARFPFSDWELAEQRFQARLAEFPEFVPPSADGGPPYWDLALLQLAPEAVPSVEPVRVAHGCATRYAAAGASVLVVGWGATVSNPTPEQQFNDTLQAGVVTLLDDVCDDADAFCRVPLGEFRAGDPAGLVDTCPGDSGAPAYVAGSGGELLVAGITSRAASTDPAFRNSCGEVSGIYVRVGDVVDWIESVMGEALPEPECDTPRVPLSRSRAGLVGLGSALLLLGLALYQAPRAASGRRARPWFPLGLD